MSIVWPSPNEVTFFDDGPPGPQGVEGWYSDRIVKGKTVFWFEGTWWKKDMKLPFYGFGDIAVDGDFWPTTPSWHSKIAFHKGFLNYADRGWNLLKEKLLECDNPIIAGHSLGGAVAQIVALRFVLETGKSVTCIVGGSPGAWGDRRARKLFRTLVPDCLSIQNGWDMVVGTKYIGTLVGLGPACECMKIRRPMVIEGSFFNALKTVLLAPAYDHFAEKYDAIMEPIIRGL